MTFKKCIYQVSRSGFTLTEVLIIVIIIAAMVSISIPRFNMSMERARNAEAIQLLESLRKAHLSYFYENNAYTSVLDDLDIEVPTPQSYNAPVALIPGAATDPIISIQRNDGSYTMRINEAGTLTCVGALCTNLGF